MKASEIITDDIVSREKHKTKDVVGKKTTSQDYFGNRADKKKDRDLVSKDKSKERKKEWFEEGEDPCWKDYKQVGMKKKNGRKVPNCVPREGVEEDSMQSAAHKKSGPKFGGYYGATQKGPPKPGQGFGGAAESVGVELDEVAPPGMEDMVLKLKKQYPDNPGRAFATAWSIYNKQKGKK